jgi:hypothetical protein
MLDMQVQIEDLTSYVRTEMGETSDPAGARSKRSAGAGRPSHLTRMTWRFERALKGQDHG